MPNYLFNKVLQQSSVPNYQSDKDVPQSYVSSHLSNKVLAQSSVPNYLPNKQVLPQSLHRKPQLVLSNRRMEDWASCSGHPSTFYRSCPASNTCTVHRSTVQNTDHRSILVLISVSCQSPVSNTQDYNLMSALITVL